MKALVINGPNINMLGIREPEVYGRDTYDDLLALIDRAGRIHGFECVEVFQSNHEGDLVDRIQQALNTVDGIVINPAAYTHTSIALLDALKAVGLPAVEVHITDVDHRETFRSQSFAGQACFTRVTGEGIQGYATALQLLAEHLNQNSAA